MTTIDHQQAAVEGALSAMEEATGYDWHNEPATVAITQQVVAAAAPHLRAAWEQEMAEKIRAKFLGPDFGRNPVNGQDSPDAALHAAYDEGLQTALALLEGGAEDK